VLAAGCAGCAAAGLLYAFPPEEGGIFPPCLFHTLTGWHCPGCGTARCLHSLLHGHVGQAVAYNLLTVIALPFLLAWAGQWVVAAVRGKPRPARHSRAWLIWALFAAIVAFWILRNVPLPPLNLLAPHEL
jgi:hypothetical protein